MEARLTKKIVAPVLGLSLLGLTSVGCGTITGAAIGGGVGAGVGAATHHSVEKSATIGAGVGGAAGALYDLYHYTRRDGTRRHDRYQD